MKKITPALLLFAMLLSVFAACGETAGDGDGSSAATSTTPATTPTTDEATKSMTDDLPADLRFDGEVFTFATYDGGNIGQGWACFFDVDEPEAGNILEEASYARNQEVEQRLGVTVSCDEPWEWLGVNDGLMSALSICSSAGKQTYNSLFLESYIHYEVFIIDELIEDVAAMPHMDLSKGYYNQDANKVYYLRDNLYFFVSDITYACQSAVMWLYNKDIMTDLGYEENYLYDKVDSGEWTYSLAMDLINAYSQDVNGDGVKDLTDQYGFSGAPFFFYPAAGLKGTYFTEDGFTFDYGTDLANEVMQEIGDLVESYRYMGGDYAYDIFFENKTLFCSWAMEIRALQGRDIHYGILPFPKYKDSQDTYDTVASGGAILIPANLDNLDMTGAVLEAMASGSAKHFVPAFYDNYIEQGVIQDERSRENWRKMLTEWGSYDFTVWITPTDHIKYFWPVISTVQDGKYDEFKSSWDARKDMVQELCDEFYDWYLAP